MLKFNYGLLEREEKISFAIRSVAVEADFDTYRNARIIGTPASDSEYPNYNWRSASGRFVYISLVYENELTRGVNLYRRLMKNIMNDKEKAIENINKNMKRKGRRITFHDIGIAQ